MTGVRRTVYTNVDVSGIYSDETSYKTNSKSSFQETMCRFSFVEVHVIRIGQGFYQTSLQQRRING